MPIKAVKEFALGAQRRLSAEIEQKASALGIKPSAISEQSEAVVAAGPANSRRERLRRELIAAINLQEAAEGDYLSAYKKVLSQANIHSQPAIRAKA